METLTDNRIHKGSQRWNPFSARTSRSTPNLMAKAKGDTSQVSKWRLPEDAYGNALQDLGDMAKADLLESQYPATQSHVLRLQHLHCGVTSITVRCSKHGKLSVGERWGTTPLKGTNEMPKSPYTRLLYANAGWPKGRESYGHGDPIVVVGVTPHRGERESRSQGKGGQVLAIPGWGGARDA
jgi:hypothetical protein